MKKAAQWTADRLDYFLYFTIAALTVAQTVKDWADPQAYIGILLAGLVALKAKRSK